MKHLSTAEVISMLGALHEELARRFCGSGTGVSAAGPLTQSKAVVAQAPPEIGLLQDSASKQYFYSVCGQTAHCSCRYLIMPATRWAAGDMGKRPQIDTRVLYVYGLDTKKDTARDSQAKLRATVARFEPSAITVVRSYAFITFPSHAAAAAAQRVLCTKGLSASFNRIMEPAEHATAEAERRARGRRGGKRRGRKNVSRSASGSASGSASEE